MDTNDAQEVLNLLTIVQMASDHSGKFSGLVNMAMTRLLEINDEARKQMQAQADADRKIEAEAKAKRDAELKAQQEKEAKEQTVIPPRPNTSTVPPIYPEGSGVIEQNVDETGKLIPSSADESLLNQPASTETPSIERRI